MRSIPLITVTAVLLCINCLIPGYFINEAEKLMKEARELHDESKVLLESSMGDAARLSVDAVKVAFRKAEILDPVVIRYVATECVTLTARKAVTLLLEKQSSHIDRIFGVNRSEAVISMLLTTYCFPLLDDIVRQTVDWQINMHDPAFNGDTAAPDIKKIVSSRVATFSITEAVRAVKGFSSEKKTPEYFSSVAMHRVHSHTYCATRNWKDHGIVYQYRVSDTGIDMKRADSAWVPLSQLPFEGTPLSIAADNNRLLVLTRQHELWWYCVKDDQAQWSIDIMKAAVAFMSLKPVLKDQICDTLLPVFIDVTDSVSVLAATYPSLKKWFRPSTRDSSMHIYWREKCSLMAELVLSIDRFFLKTDGDDSFTAEDYKAWSSYAHAGGQWSNLLSWQIDNDTLTRGHNLVTDHITDIAIGNWNGTVVTCYALADGKIWFMDEEIIQPEWKPVDKWNKGWMLLGQKEYTPISNSPYPLDSTAQIDASNSVIGVLSHADDTAVVHWLRWDYHQKDDFIYWPLDWCNHGWRSVIFPHATATNFSISTIERIDPREHETVWSIPAPAFTLHEYIPEQGYKGIFGDIPRTMVDKYPVDLFLGTENDTIYHFAAKRSEKVNNPDVSWKRILP